MIPHEKKVAGAISIAILVPILLYAAGILAQFIININAWKAAGSDYRTSPGLPSLSWMRFCHRLLHFPEGLISIGIVVVDAALLCFFGLRLGRGGGGITDQERNLTISSFGSYGTAAFMDEGEAKSYFDITSPAQTDRDILGMTTGGKVITLPRNTRLNQSLAVCGAPGTGKSRSISRNLILQAAKRGRVGDHHRHQIGALRIHKQIPP